MAVFHSRMSNSQLLVLVFVVLILGFLCAHRLLSGGGVYRSAAHSTKDKDEDSGIPVDLSSVGAGGGDKQAALQKLGVYFSRGPDHWLRKSCAPGRKFRAASILTGIGNLTFYIYDNGFVDTSVSERALHGEMFERQEIERFLLITRHLPLIDVGANVGLVTLQAAMQGREVLAVEPIPENALRLCRSALDFGGQHSSRVHVLNNAASSSEGSVTMAMDIPRHVAHFEVSRGEGWGYGATSVHCVLMDRLLEVLPFKTAALKIDVESHEGHVIAGSKRLFQEIDIPMVWMEWEFVKKIKGPYGPQPILQFMKEHAMQPHDLMTGLELSWNDYMFWPFTVLWVKEGYTYPTQ
ncbi:uncharacterized protein LOC143286528 [Babylonia areolata]|uniref:uncharacterized protein LOC143286528 n=1 Tax=Babylonia areolata TaxID=304850 RepID=UPI003FD64A77